MGARKKLPIIIGCVVMLLAILSLSACEKRDWGKAQQTNSIEGYKAYMAKYPKGKFAADATKAIEGLEWKKAGTDNTADAFQAFIDKYPNSPNVAEAQAKIAELKQAALVEMEKEAADNLVAIAAAEETYKAANKKYLAAMASPAEGGTDGNADAWADAGGFTDLGFTPSGDVLYKYEVTVGRNGTSFRATASGDLDENGIGVVFTITNDNPTPTKSPENEH